MLISTISKNENVQIFQEILLYGFLFVISVFDVEYSDSINYYSLEFNIFWHFLKQIVQVSEICPHGRQSPTSYFTFWQYCDCWPGNKRSLGISSHCINLVLLEYSNIRTRSVNLLWFNHAIWSTLAQDIACCLTTPSHYLNQCELIINWIFLASWNWSLSYRGTSMSVWLSVGLSNIFQVPKGFAVYGR